MENLLTGVIESCLFHVGADCRLTAHYSYYYQLSRRAMIDLLTNALAEWLRLNF